MKCYTCSVDLCGAETGTVRKVDKKCPETVEVWCWKKMGISWTNRKKN
jgi:hypothetical protein